MQGKVIRLAGAGLLALILPLTLQACEGGTPTATDTTTQPTEATAPAETGEGVLIVRANGEERIREGFTSVDGWTLDFDNVFVTMANMTAYQTDPPFNPQAGDQLNPQESVSLPGPVTVDLTEEGDTADTVRVTETQAPAGRYNALSWDMVGAPEGPAQGYTLVMAGTATRDGESIPFVLRFAEEMSYTCGDFVGDERKGILTGGDQADLEATFHFDHLFGNGDNPASDVNETAFGFDPFAALADGGRVELSSVEMREQLPPDQYQQLLEILPTLGHVGEGHCEETALTT